MADPLACSQFHNFVIWQTTKTLLPGLAPGIFHPIDGGVIITPQEFVFFGCCFFVFWNTNTANKHRDKM